MDKIRARSAKGFIATEADVARGAKALRRACPIMARIHAVAGDPPLRRQPAGFEGLARIIVGQQLSTASASAIWGRCGTTISPFSVASILQANDDELRGCGLSRPKVRTLRAVAGAVADGGLDIEGLERASDDEVHAALTSVSGIGPWTADVYVMFCLGRADAFAAGDLALQIAAQHAAGLDTRPSPAELLTLAERWRPWRAVAALMLWAYYPHIKKQRSAAPDSGQPL